MTFGSIKQFVRGDDYTQQLAQRLKRSSRACKWAIVDRKPDKAAHHAAVAARTARLYLQRIGKWAPFVE